MSIAWFTALMHEGVSRQEMEAYVKDYSPYVIDRGKIDEHQRVQDVEIGRINGIQQDVLKRFSKLESERPN